MKDRGTITVDKDEVRIKAVKRVASKKPLVNKSWATTKPVLNLTDKPIPMSKLDLKLKYL